MKIYTYKRSLKTRPKAKLTNFVYRTIIEPDEKGYHGFVPLLKGVHTVGNTIEETKDNLAEAIRCHLEGLRKDGIMPPQEKESVEVIQTITFNA